MLLRESSGRGRPVVALALALLGATACGRARLEDIGASGIPAPSADDRGEICADVGEVRACWGTDLSGARCERGACLMARTLPAGTLSASGWRCDGMRDGRLCTPRARGAGPFSCDGDTCVQAQPRTPDTGEWDCAEVDGAVRCVGGLAAAGAPAGPADRGWLCGPRRGGIEGDRVCVDFAPDWPEIGVDVAIDGGAVDPGAAWRCKFVRKNGLARVCQRDASPERARLGGACSAAMACPAGSACIGARCLPARPAPSCYQDDDCGGGKCRTGTCAPSDP